VAAGVQALFSLLVNGWINAPKQRMMSSDIG
jgi:hypothetical protein